MEGEGLEGALRKARRGDREAFAHLYRTFLPRVRGLCRRLLGSEDRAEEATSEVFLRAERAMESYDETLPFSRWILGIAGHLCVDRLRRRGVEGRLFRTESLEEDEVATPAPSPLTTLVAREVREELRRAIDALPDRYRLPLVLRYFDDLSYDRIGKTLGLRRSYVATLLFRARQELRRSMEAKTKERRR